MMDEGMVAKIQEMKAMMQSMMDMMDEMMGGESAPENLSEKISKLPMTKGKMQGM